MLPLTCPEFAGCRHEFAGVELSVTGRTAFSVPQKRLSRGRSAALGKTGFSRRSVDRTAPPVIPEAHKISVDQNSITGPL